MAIFISLATSFEKSSKYVLQDANNFIIGLNAKADQSITNILQEVSNNINPTINLNVLPLDGIQVGGIKQLGNSSIFSENGIQNIKRPILISKLLNLPSPPGYVPVKWGSSSKNLNLDFVPVNYYDITIDVKQCGNNNLLGMPIIVFSVDTNNEINNIYKLYKIKSKDNYNAELTIAKNNFSGKINLVTCNTNNFLNSECSNNYTKSKPYISKLKYRITERNPNTNNENKSTLISYGLLDARQLFTGSKNIFNDVNGLFKGIVIIEGNISLPYANNYTFQCVHDCGIEININNNVVLSNPNSGTDTSGSIKYNTDSLSFSIKIFNNSNNNNSITLKYKTDITSDFDNVSEAWFSTVYYTSISDGLTEIYSRQREYCNTNLDQQWCKDLAKVNTNINNDIYDNYCINNKNYLVNQTKYDLCKNNYGEVNSIGGSNIFTKDVISYCTDTNRLFNSSCLNGGTIEPAYLTANIWDSRMNYCDVNKFKTDVNCQNIIKDPNNTHLFDKLLFDNCKPGETNISCLAGLNAFQTNSKSIPYYSQQTYAKCINADGSIDADSKLCIDTALDKTSSYSASLIEPMVKYCKTGDNITNINCKSFIEKNPDCIKSTFMANNCNSSDKLNNVNYSNYIITIIMLFIMVILIKLNFKIDCVYTNYQTDKNNDTNYQST